MKTPVPGITDATKRNDLQDFADGLLQKWFRLPFVYITMPLQYARAHGLDTLSLRRRGCVWALSSIVWSVPLVAGCDSRGWGQSGVDGYWKGQMAEVATDDQQLVPNARNRVRPLRILMRLQEEAGSVRGIVAQSSDAIAFRQLDNGSSRSVSTHTVTGTREGSRIRMRFSNDTGRTFEIDASVSAKRISGFYSAQHGPASPDAGVIEEGEFEVERY